MNKIILYDINKQLCDSWNKYFKDVKEVKVINCSFKDLESEYVVTAGNSYGWMTGGIDLAVRDYYGQVIQDKIQQLILAQPKRCLDIGNSIIIYTGDDKKPYLIYAPTMDLPKEIDDLDIFYVFSKLLRTYDVDFACCGLGTCTGGLSYDVCAKTMYNAYRLVRG